MEWFEEKNGFRYSNISGNKKMAEERECFSDLKHCCGTAGRTEVVCHKTGPARARRTASSIDVSCGTLIGYPALLSPAWPELSKHLRPLSHCRKNAIAGGKKRGWPAFGTVCRRGRITCGLRAARFAEYRCQITTPCILVTADPEHTRRWNNVGLMLVQRNLKPTLVQCLVAALEKQKDGAGPILCQCLFSYGN